MELREKIAKTLFDKIGREVPSQCLDCHYREPAVGEDPEKCSYSDQCLEWLDTDGGGDGCPQDRDFCKSLVDQILALIKEAGWVSPEIRKRDIQGAIEGTRDGMKQAGYVHPDDYEVILHKLDSPEAKELLRKHSYVKLSDDQNLPENPKTYAKLGSVDYHEYNGSFVNTYTVYKQAQQDMLKANFRRVEL